MSNNNIILELSNKSAQTQVNNGDFETAFQPIAINNGDVIQIKNAFIDTTQPSYTQIYLPEDVNIILPLCFYEIDAALAYGTKTYSASHGTQADWSMYFMFAVDRVIPNIGMQYTLNATTFRGVIKKGMYTPDSLAIEINRLFVSIGSPQSRYSYDNTFIFQTANVSYPYFIRVGNGNSELLTDIYYQYAQNQNYWTGARQVALLYNSDNDGRFRFDYLHTPYYDDNGNETISFVGDEGSQPVNRSSGCMFLDMQPRDFWTALGFNIDEMTPKFSSYTIMQNNLNYPNTNYFFNVPKVLSFNNDTMTTENLITIDDMYGQPFGAAGSGETANEVMFRAKVSNKTRGLYASNFFSFKPLCPFLLIEFLTNFNGTYLTGSDTSKFITAIVSRNYTTNNYITGYSDSSIVYQHKGETFLLSSIRTRILNPDTKDIPTDIGPNNYIIVQIIKNTS